MNLRDFMSLGLSVQGLGGRPANEPYTRIVRGDELLADVHFEAELHDCKVWVNSELRKAVISKNRPADKDSYIQLNIKSGRVYQVFGKRDKE